MSKKISAITIKRFALLVVLGTAYQAMAQDAATPYPNMADRPPDPDFWNPKVRTPICLSAAAARSYLPRTIKRTDLILAGRSKAQTDKTIVAAVDNKELPAMEFGAMCYMMLEQGYGGDSVKHWPHHLMFYYSQTDPATWGANPRVLPSSLLATPRSTWPSS
ncbi:MAG: hypothetical protein WB762_25020 [Candidatus Sulfotelmatobacter sp.]